MWPFWFHIVNIFLSPLIYLLFLFIIFTLNYWSKCSGISASFKPLGRFSNWGNTLLRLNLSDPSFLRQTKGYSVLIVHSNLVTQKDISKSVSNWANFCSKWKRRMSYGILEKNNNWTKNSFRQLMLLLFSSTFLHQLRAFNLHFRRAFYWWQCCFLDSVFSSIVSIGLIWGQEISICSNSYSSHVSNTHSFISLH